MKCEECLAALESGNVWRRRAARRHAAGCAACAEAIAALGRLKGEMATVEPLSAAQRQRWLSVAVGAPAAVRRRHTAAYAALGGAAVAAILAIGVWLMRDADGTSDARSGGSKRLVATSNTAPLVIRRDPAVRQGLVELSAELDRLARAAALIDERRQVRDLMVPMNPDTPGQQP
jgi:hypothetical protein